MPDAQVMFAIMEPLITLTPEYELRPRLATSWVVEDDGRSIRLVLREDVLFHDGTAFTSEDVKFTLEAALDGRNEGLVSYLADVLELVETPDPATAIVRFNQPAAYALYDLALIPMMPAEAAADFGDHPIGTGPYRFDLVDARPTGTWIVTRVFEDYWGDAPSFDTVEFRLFGGGVVNELAATLANGRLDLAQATMDGDMVRELPNHRGLEVRSVPGTTSAYVAMNTTAAPLDDLRVRSAISHLIPRERIVESVLSGYGFPTSTVLGTATPWSDADAGTPYDPVRAQALLDEAGVRVDRPLTLLTNEGNRSRERIAEELEETFGQHGVVVRTELDTFPTVVGRGASGDFELLLSGWVSYGNPVRRVISALQGLNYPAAAYSSDRIVELAEVITRLDVSSGAGAEAFRELVALLAAEGGFAYVYLVPTTGVQLTGLRGWGPHPVAGLAYQDLQGVKGP